MNRDTVRTVTGVVSMRSKVVRQKGVRGIAGWRGMVPVRV